MNQDTTEQIRAPRYSSGSCRVEDIATTLPDYRDDARCYEIEERARPDEMLMLRKAGEKASSILDCLSKATCLDMCCGTGLSLEHIARHRNVAYVVGVDISSNYLAFAKKKYSTNKDAPIHFILGDAVSVALPVKRWDLIMMASAYHHIEDERKVAFLRRVRHLIGSTGHAVMAENILPDYTEGDAEEYKASVRIFYDQVLSSARQQNPDLPRFVEGLIERVAQYGFDGDYEYKVCMKIFKRHLTKTGLEIVDEARVWPDESIFLDADAGNFVFHVTANTS